MMMQKGQIPLHCGIKQDSVINSNFPTDLHKRGVHIPFQQTSWPRPCRREGKRRVFVNNFSAAGGNTALLMEDAPILGPASNIPDTTVPLRSRYIVVLSAASNKSLEANLRALADYIGHSSSRELLAEISYTTTARRMQHSRRVAVAASDLPQLKSLLLEEITKVENVRPVSSLSKASGVGFLFTGQGAQKTAMARGLYEHFSAFRNDIQEFDAIATSQGFPSILPLVDGSIEVENLPYYHPARHLHHPDGNGASLDVPRRQGNIRYWSQPRGIRCSASSRSS